MIMLDSLAEYGWTEERPHTEAFLYPQLQSLMAQIASALVHSSHALRVLDLGCGNGALCSQLCQSGYQVVGVDPSPKGIAIARRRCPDAVFHLAAAHPEHLAALNLPLFDLVISTEVVEHCYAPRDWAQAAFQALKPGGWLICSTPYHGYAKNLALAITGKLDSHFTALWDGGHIKFWSRRTLTILLHEVGFQDSQFRGAGRLPWLWKSMLIAARKPPSSHRSTSSLN